jgi:zinc transporter, ZIP family
MSQITRSNFQFFAGVLFFGLVVKFIPEPDFSPKADLSEKQVGTNSRQCFFLERHINLFFSLK